MRAKLGRPDLGTWADRFDVPSARAGDLSVTFLGVATVLLDDGESALLTDGFFSRPGLLQVAAKKLAPDTARIDACLARARISRLEAVMPVHSHYDHALDSAVVAERTGAVLAGGSSTANIGRGGGLPESRIVTVTPGEPLRLGAYEVTWIESHHCPPDRYPGTIDAPLVPPAKTGAYRCGEAWSILVVHDSGRTALLQGSAGFVAGSLAGQSAEVAYLGVGQLGLMPEDYLESYWDETVGQVGASRVVLTHWDDFFRGLERPLRSLPYAGDDLDVTMRVFDRLSARDGVPVSFPTVWRREHPWR